MQQPYTRRGGGIDVAGRLTGSSHELRAKELFAPLGQTYDRYASLLSFGQDPRWRRFLVSRVPARPSDRVLDVATGTAAVAMELARSKGCRVVGLDQSAEMLAEARRRVVAAGLGERIELVEGTALELPFADASFDHLTVTYLLRYVPDPDAAARELVRVVAPEGTVAMLEFAVPHRLATRALWESWVRVGLPAAGRVISPGWHDVGRFLGPSIREFGTRFPPERLATTFAAAGLRDVRVRRLSLGGGLVLWGTRE
jgi:demethylmenaquinone methyltransferase / 2-methoxy-6-polyprenyl-1,4-benzoquinol methylase